jgi:hypothetical protein
MILSIETDQYRKRYVWSRETGEVFYQPAKSAYHREQEADIVFHDNYAEVGVTKERWWPIRRAKILADCGHYKEFRVGYPLGNDPCAACAAIAKEEK